MIEDKANSENTQKLQKYKLPKRALMMRVDEEEEQETTYLNETMKARSKIGIHYIHPILIGSKLTISRFAGNSLRGTVRFHNGVKQSDRECRKIKPILMMNKKSIEIIKSIHIDEKFDSHRKRDDISIKKILRIFDRENRLSPHSDISWAPSMYSKRKLSRFIEAMSKSINVKSIKRMSIKLPTVKQKEYNVNNGDGGDDNDDFNSNNDGSDKKEQTPTELIRRFFEQIKRTIYPIDYRITLFDPVVWKKFQRDFDYSRVMVQVNDVVKTLIQLIFHKTCLRSIVIDFSSWRMGIYNCIDFVCWLAYYMYSNEFKFNCTLSSIKRLNIILPTVVPVTHTIIVYYSPEEHLMAALNMLKNITWLELEINSMRLNHFSINMLMSDVYTELDAFKDYVRKQYIANNKEARKYARF